MNEVPVETSGWTGGKNQQVILTNDSDSDVRIVRTTVPFPFKTPSPITVKAHAKITCQLIEQEGTFLYGVASLTAANPAGNSKNVIIS